MNEHIFYVKTQHFLIQNYVFVEGHAVKSLSLMLKEHKNKKFKMCKGYQMSSQ